MNLFSLQKTIYSFEFSNWARTAMVGLGFARNCWSAGLYGAEMGIVLGDGSQTQRNFVRIQV